VFIMTGVSVMMSQIFAVMIHSLLGASVTQRASAQYPSRP
jgi:hypothetical protein